MHHFARVLLDRYSWERTSPVKKHLPVVSTVFPSGLLTNEAYIIAVFSLFGVVLIARPAFLFGNTVPSGGDTDRLEKGTPAQRLMAVGFVGSFSIPSHNA